MFYHSLKASTFVLRVIIEVGHQGGRVTKSFMVRNVKFRQNKASPVAPTDVDASISQPPQVSSVIPTFNATNRLTRWIDLAAFGTASLGESCIGWHLFGYNRVVTNYLADLAAMSVYFLLQPSAGIYAPGLRKIAAAQIHAFAPALVLAVLVRFSITCWSGAPYLISLQTSGIWIFLAAAMLTTSRVVSAHTLSQSRIAKKPTRADRAGGKIMGVRLDNLHRRTLAENVILAAQQRHKILIVSANAHLMVLAQSRPWLRNLFQQADLAICDGAGVQVAAYLLASERLHRSTPPEWIGTVLQALGPQASVFWLGGKSEVVVTAARRYEEQYGIRTVGMQHGYFDKSKDSEDTLALVARINQAEPSILLVNMGMPLQERWLNDAWPRINARVGIAAGALVDHIAGNVHRPPRWVANIGCEWIVRLVREPRRLWRRYLIGLPIFAFLVLVDVCHRRRKDPAATTIDSCNLPQAKPANPSLDTTVIVETTECAA